MSEKTPSQLLLEADCITASRKCKSSRDTEAIRRLTRKYVSFSFAFGEKILMGKLERSILCLQDYSNVEVKTEKKMFDLEPQAGRVL